MFSPNPITGVSHSFGQTGICLTPNLLKRKKKRKKESKKKEKKKKKKKKEGWYVYCPLLPQSPPPPFHRYRFLSNQRFWLCNISAYVHCTITTDWNKTELRQQLLVNASLIMVYFLCPQSVLLCCIRFTCAFAYHNHCLFNQNVLVSSRSMSSSTSLLHNYTHFTMTLK